MLKLYLLNIEIIGSKDERSFSISVIRGQSASKRCDSIGVIGSKVKERIGSKGER